MARISEIMLLQQPEQPVLIVEVHTDMNGMTKAIGDNYESLTEQDIRMIIGFKSSGRLQGKEDIKSVIVPARKIVSCLHRGSYNELAALYNEMTEWIKLNGYKASGSSIEYYYSNPDVPEAEQVTRVEMPVF